MIALVATRHLSDSHLASIQAACERNTVDMHPWRDGRPNLQAPPTLVIAGLAPGSRRVSEDLTELLRDVFPTSPLLVLCEEPLRRPTMTTQAGRITLLGPPLSPALIASRTRMLLAMSDEPVLLEPAEGVVTREHCCASYWVGSLMRGSGGSMRVHQSDQGSMTAIVSLDPPGDDARDRDRMNAVVELLEGDAGKREARLREIVGPNDGVIHLGPAASAWSIFWRVDWPLDVFSPQRMPRLWDASRSLAASGRRWFSLPAAAGDLVVGATAPAHVPRPELEAALGAGGPAALEMLAHGQHSGAAKCAVVAEVL